MGSHNAHFLAIRMDIDENLDILLELEREQQGYNDVIECISLYGENELQTIIQKRKIMFCKLYLKQFMDRQSDHQKSSTELTNEINQIDPELEAIINETVELNELEDEIEQQKEDQEEEVREQYIFTVPPDGKSALCKLQNVYFI